MPQSRCLGLGRRSQSELSAPLAAGGLTGAVVNPPPRSAFLFLFCAIYDTESSLRKFLQFDPLLELAANSLQVGGFYKSKESLF